jgi:hypothetical protein
MPAAEGFTMYPCEHLPSHILSSKKTTPVIRNETKSMVTDDSMISLLSDNPRLKLLLKLVKAFFSRWEASCIWLLHLTINIRFLSDIIDHILGWK